MQLSAQNKLPTLTLQEALACGKESGGETEVRLPLVQRNMYNDMAQKYIVETMHITTCNIVQDFGHISQPFI